MEKPVFAGDGATAHNRIIKPYRPFITHAKGSKKWDVDGNEYVDYTMGHGALLLGHSHSAVVSAIQEQAAKGLHYGDSHELEIRWAERVQELIASAELVRFTGSGTEATMMAIRLARAFTGRNTLVRFQAHFHGWNDNVVGAPPPLADEGVNPHALGVPDQTLANVVDLVAKRLDADACSIYLTDVDLRHLTLNATIGLDPRAVHRVRLAIGEGLVGVSAERGQPVSTAHAQQHPDYRYFPESGEERWHKALVTDRGQAVPVRAGPAINGDGSQLFVATESGSLYALATTDGFVKWSRAAEGQGLSRPLVRDSLVFQSLILGDARIRAVQVEDGREVWVFPPPEEED